MNRPTTVASTPATSTGQRWRAALPLARYMTRQTWRLLGAICLGLALAVALAGAVPLFSQVTITVGLRNFLAQSSDQMNFRITGYENGMSFDLFNHLNQSVTQDMRTQISGYLQPTPLLTLNDTPTAHLLQANGNTLPDDIHIRATDLHTFAPYLHLLAGRMPMSLSQNIEIAITDDTAVVLNIPIQGFTPQKFIIEFSADNNLKPELITVVGIVANPTTPHQVWADNTLAPVVSDSGFGDLKAIASNQTFLTVFQRDFVSDPHNSFIPTFLLYWYQEINPNGFTSESIANARTHFATFQDTIINDLNAQHVVSPVALSSLFDPDSLLTRYYAHIVSTQVPVTLIFLGILGSALLFVSLLADILVERQSGVIAVLRSRGFSRWQIFGAIAVQSLVVCVLALVAGALGALPLGRLLAFWQLPASDHTALATIGGNPIQVVANVWVYMALVTMGALLALLVASLSAVDMTIQTLFTLIGVDTKTYPRTAVWPSQDLPQSLPQLLAHITPATEQYVNRVPAIVDAATWDAFHLAPGKIFTLKSTGANTGVTFVAVAQVPAIPQTPVGTDGILVDLDTYAMAYTQSTHAYTGVTGNLYLSQAWLRTQDTAAAQQIVRLAIASLGGPDELYLSHDRRAIRDGLAGEPLTITLLALLVVAIGAPLLLALVATLIAAWQNVRQRLASLALLRALGATPQQLLRMIAWEQGFIFAATIVLGTGIGYLFALTTLPNLVFTDSPLMPTIPVGIVYPIDIPSINNIYQAQHLPPVRMIFPPTIALAVGILIVVSAISVAIMVGIAGRASLSQSLRLNED